MKTLKVLTAASLAVATATSAFAQFTQQPDLTPNNVGVGSTFVAPQTPGNPKVNPIVGDDWQGFSGPVTQIAIWGSWLNDVVDPTVTFKLSIHRDNPPGSAGVPWSRPGQEIWSYVGNAASTTLAASGLSGNYYDFTTGTMGASSEAYRFDFNFGGNAFQAQSGNIYWLVVQAQTTSGSKFAWNSSYQHFADAAVWGNSSSFGSTRVVFNPMDYAGIPGMDPSLGNVDLAFSIIPEPSSMAIIGLGLAALALRRKIS
jgi:hypothetical protein